MQQDKNSLLGKRLAEIRKEKGLSLAAVAKLTGMSRSTLYKVEANGMSLTYPKLIDLCTGLKIDIAELFSESAKREAKDKSVTARLVYGSLDESADHDSENYHYYFPCHQLIGKRLTPIYGICKARTVEEFGERTSHTGEEFTIVLDGEIEVHTDYYKPVHLKSGQYIFLDSTMGHAFISVSENPAKILTVCSSPLTITDELIDEKP